MTDSPDVGLRTIDALARSILVRDIAVRVANVDSDWDWSDVTMELGDIGTWFAVVYSGSQQLGFITMDDDWNGRTAGESCSRFDIGMLVEESAPLLEMTHVFRRTPFFFCLSGNRVHSVVSWRDIDRLHGRFALMGLLMGLEAALDAFLLARLDVCLELIPRNRLENAQVLARVKYGTEAMANPNRAPALLYSCLMLADKATTFRKVTRKQQLVVSGTGFLKSVFSQVERVRNQIAHGNSVLQVLPGPEDIADFVGTIRQLIVNVQDLSEGDLTG